MPRFGFTIRLDFERPEPSLVEGFRGAATGNLGDALGRSAAMSARIKPVTPAASTFCGVALTLRARPADNLLVWKALDMARPGDVLVIATGGYEEHACLGDLLARVAAARGVAAVVTDGAVRDADGLAEVGMPVFAAAVTPNSPQKDGPGDLNLPVTCGGQVVEPGDILVGDRDGVVVVPRREAAAALSELQRVQANERERLAQIARGELIPGWVDAALAERQARMIDTRAAAERP